ncbi:MAG: ABC transporter ATP-binding protein [Candidatus Altimarinota bacterium]
MNYKLNKTDINQSKDSFFTSIKKLSPLMKGENKNLTITLIMVIITSLSSLIIPIIITHTIDNAVKNGDYNGILINSLFLFLIFIIGAGANYFQTIVMGGVGRRILFNLRNTLFTKIQELPVSFFNQNKSGDLISRINNDTDKLNMFFSQSLMQFLGNFFLIFGSGIFILVLNFELGLFVLLPALFIFIISQILSSWVKRKNKENLEATGAMSSEIQENLNNFKVIVAFNRLDYFRKKFENYNQKNYIAGLKAGNANNIFVPIYSFASNLAQLITLCYGIYLIQNGNLTVGLLIGFLFYVNNFYTPLRQLASVWASFQLALASLSRIGEVLSLKTDLEVSKDKKIYETDAILEFRDVGFHYVEGKEILKNISFSLEKGKTYALVGPTGGGKTTTAQLMARLYDPTSGNIILDKKDMKSYEPMERTKKIGFILQEPFLFTGNLKDNILYSNEEYINYSIEETNTLLKEMGLSDLLSKFDAGLETEISVNGDSISLGQKQLIAFIRAILRKPELLILDEATANIDTVTEELLESMIEKLPKYTTKVIIAHRLNTIKNADCIFFVNSGEIINTGSMENAIEMLLHGKSES